MQLVKNRIATLSLGLLLLAMAGIAQAAQVMHWKQEGGKWTLAFTDGTVQSWSYGKGVEVKAQGKDKSELVARDLVINVTVFDAERPERYRNALISGNTRELLAIASDATVAEYLREEAAYQAALRQASVAGWQGFLRAFPSGNFALDANITLAYALADNGKGNDALAGLRGAMNLGGDVATARANFVIGRIHHAAGKTNDAIAAFSLSAGAADKTAFTSDRIKAHAWHGLALRDAKRPEDAKREFTLADEMLIGLDSSDGVNTVYAKGIAAKGIADLSGQTKAAYMKYQVACYWLETGPLEPECLVGMLGIAEKFAASGSTEEERTWGKERAEKLRERMQLMCPGALADYDKAKGK